MFVQLQTCIRNTLIKSFNIGNRVNYGRLWVPNLLCASLIDFTQYSLNICSFSARTYICLPKYCINIKSLHTFVHTSVIMSDTSDLCIECGVTVRHLQHAISCDVCENWQHRICNTGKYYIIANAVYSAVYICQTGLKNNHLNLPILNYFSWKYKFLREIAEVYGM